MVSNPNPGICREFFYQVDSSQDRRCFRNASFPEKLARVLQSFDLVNLNLANFPKLPVLAPYILALVELISS